MGIIIKHFDSSYLFIDTNVIYYVPLKNYLKNIFSLNEEWNHITFDDFNDFFNNLKTLTHEYLSKAADSFEPNHGSNFQFDFEGKSYLINLRSDDGRLAKFFVKIYYIFKANFFSGYNVELKLGDKDFLKKV